MPRRPKNRQTEPIPAFLSALIERTALNFLGRIGLLQTTITHASLALMLL
jgi:hypothetical protein